MTNFLVVGIGASAGGIQALRQFFTQVHKDSGIAYVVILHLSPDHDSQLAEVLQLSATIPVTQVQDRVQVEPNHVYVIPPTQSLAMVNGHLELSPITRFEERRAPVDIFFRTLAESHHAHAVSVILSGTGGNGSMGLKRVKEMGGICLVQDPDEAEYSDMPRNAIATSLVDQVMPVADIPARIAAYRDRLNALALPDPSSDSPLDRPAANEQALRALFSQMRARTGHDFSDYKRATVRRRIERRMSLHNVGDLPEYAAFVTEHPEESRALLKDLLISVTNFFRDREAFEQLDARVVPRLFENKTRTDQIRVWVAACATGEEAYSLAMLLAEHAATMPDGPGVQLFATDIDAGAIAIAREGLYTLNDAADVSPERLRRFFVKEGEAYRVRKELRETILFAHHNVIKDPPFSHLDLASCRNLLIYLNRVGQRRVMEVMHFALNPGAYLFLGGSESIEGAGDLFVSYRKEAHLFQSRAVAVRPPMPVAELTVPGVSEPPRDGERAAHARVRERLSAADLHQRLLEQYAPPSIVIDQEHEIVHVSERAGRYLQFVGGEPSHNLLKAIRPELRLELRTAIYQATQQRSDVEAPGLIVRTDDRTVTLNVIVRPVLGDGDTARGFFLVLFEEIPDGAKPPSPPLATAIRSDDAARHLEEEVQRVKTQLRATSEQHETQAEELKASNEELQAMNEELRSSAEELETSKEELQSLNEELRTVNQELKTKVEEQAQANDDIQNLIGAAEIGTIFLDRQLRIKLFTPYARQIFALIPADYGRPLSDISSALVGVDLHGDVERVLDHLERIEREVRTRDDRWHLMRVLPYRTAEDRIDGVVLTFVDITARKRDEEALRVSEERLRRAILSDTIGVLFFRADGVVTDANDTFLRMSGYSREDVEHGLMQWDRLTPAEYRVESVRAREASIPSDAARNDEKEYLRKDGSRFWAMFSASAITAQETVEFVVDITTRKRAEERLRWSEHRLRLIVESVADYAIFTLSAQGVIDTWNPGASNLFGYLEEDAIGLPAAQLFTAEDRQHGVSEGEMRRADQDGRASDERWHLRRDGSQFFAISLLAPMRDPSGTTIGYVKIARDLTERKRWEDELRDAHSSLECRVEERTQELGRLNQTLDAELQERRQAEEQVHALIRRLLTVQEDERRRIARDLHDHLGQQLAGIRLNVDGLLPLARRNRALQSGVENAQRQLEKLDRDLDFFTWELRPATLGELSLTETLGTFVREWSKEFGIAAEFHSAGLRGASLSYEIETNLYRIAQEALNNIYKHAHATHAAVLLDRRRNELVLVIEDNGSGFERPDVAPSDDRGIGLLGMRERAALIGGSFEIETAPGKGTTIYARVPLPPAADRPPPLPSGEQPVTLPGGD